MEGPIFSSLKRLQIARNLEAISEGFPHTPIHDGAQTALKHSESLSEHPAGRVLIAVCSSIHPPTCPASRTCVRPFIDWTFTMYQALSSFSGGLPSCRGGNQKAGPRNFSVKVLCIRSSRVLQTGASNTLKGPRKRRKYWVGQRVCLVFSI